MPGEPRMVPVYGGRAPEVVCHALVDDEDFEAVMAAASPRWTVHSEGYVVTGQRGSQMLMHRLVIGAPKGVKVDHRSGDKMDNRRSNLRPATEQQNQANRQKFSGSSRFKGVSWDRYHGRWAASVKVDGRKRHLGYFDSESMVAAAYDRAASEAFGEYARGNNARGA